MRGSCSDYKDLYDTLETPFLGGLENQLDMNDTRTEERFSLAPPDSPFFERALRSYTESVPNAQTPISFETNRQQEESFPLFSFVAHPLEFRQNRK